MVLERGAAVAGASRTWGQPAFRIRSRCGARSWTSWAACARTPAAPRVPCGGQGSGDQHLLSVCNLSLLLGQAIGLDDSALGDLGVAAMLHDVGYANGASKDGHAAAGFRALLKQRGFHEGKIRRLRVVLEHHEPHSGALLSLFARILHIADDYDMLTAAHASEHTALPPPIAQGAMWAARGRPTIPISSPCSSR